MIDLVLCTNGLLYKAPAFSDLKKGDEVIVESNSGMKEVNTNIDCSLSIDPNVSEDEFLFILRLSKTMTPLKRILRKVEEIELKYKEEAENEI